MAAASGAGGLGESQQPDLQCLSQAIDQAVFSCAETSVPRLPWEEEGLSLIFGQNPLDVVWGSSPDRVPLPIPAAPDAPLEEKAQAAKKAKIFDKEMPCFIKCVNFRNQATDEELESGKWRKALEKWYVLVNQDPTVSLVGASIVGLSVEEGMTSLRELFGRKSSATVDKRGSALIKYIKYMHESHPHRPAFPLSTLCVDLCVRHLKTTNAKASMVSSFMEAVQFAVHVVGVSTEDSGAGQLISPWARGYQGLLNSEKGERHPALVLTVRQVAFLEESLWDEGLGLVDRYASGVFLFCIFSRSRISDIRKVHGFIVDVAVEGSVAAGFLECGTRNHKTALQTKAVGMAMPLVAPVNGVRQVPWGLQFLKVAEEAGLPFGTREKGPLLPAPAQTGGWSCRAVSSTEAGSWLRALLSRGNACGEGVTGHSLKSTTLDWAGKYGLSDKDQTLLGHHALKGESMYSYMRDKLASPLRAYEQMLQAVRHSLFIPDSTRSGMFRSSPVEVSEASGHLSHENLRRVIPEGRSDVQQGGALSERLSEEPEGMPGHPSRGEQEHYAAIADSPKSKALSILEEVWPHQSEEAPREPVEPAGLGGSPCREQTDSSSSSSSSESEGSEGDHEWLGDLDPALSKAVPKAKPLEPDLEFWKHPKTLTIHSFAAGSSKNAFTCGRKHTSDYVRITESAFLSSRLCEVCKKSKPLRDCGALVSMLDRGLRSR